MVVAVGINTVMVVPGVIAQPVMERLCLLNIAHIIGDHFVYDPLNVRFDVLVYEAHILCAVEIGKDEVSVFTAEIARFAVEGWLGIYCHQ